MNPLQLSAIYSIWLYKGVRYRIIKNDNHYMQVNGVWKPALIYCRVDDPQRTFSRALDDWNDKFEFVGF